MTIKTRPRRKQVQQQPRAALQGIKVIEYGAFQQAPLAAKWLVEAGAEVIKLEGLPGGDPGRGVTSALTSGRSLNAPNWFHEYLNRGKKSVALNMDSDGAKEAISRLVARADVFVTNLRLPTLKKSGLDYQSLSTLNPGLVYAQGTGFGLRGPDADKPVLDLVGQARSGVLNFMGNLDNFAAVGNWSPVDKVSALQLAYGILLALLFRERTGQGQLVDTSLLGGGMYLSAFEIQYYVGSGELSARFDRRGIRNPLRNIYQTRDGRWLCFGMTQGDRYWPEFCRALGIEHLQHEPRFKDMTARAANQAELIKIIDQVMSTKTRDEWQRELPRYNLIWCVVNSIPDLAQDLQVNENGYLIDWLNEESRSVRGIGPLVGLSRAPLDVGVPAPELGQHTEEVLLEAGYSWEDLAALKNNGVII